MTHIKEVHLLRENSANGVHKAFALQNLLGIPVINTPVGVIEPEHETAKILILLKYEALIAAYQGIGICAVADLFSTVGGLPSRKPPSHIPPHNLARYIAEENMTHKTKNLQFIEASTIVFGKKPKRQKPLIGISTLKVSFPTKLLTNRRFIEDIHGESGLGVKNAQIPGGIDLSTTLALARKKGLNPLLSAPSNFRTYIDSNPKYLTQRMTIYEDQNRLNKAIMDYLTPIEIVILLDSALNSSGNVIKPLWDKFNKH